MFGDIRKVTFVVLIILKLSAYAQPINDLCGNATNIGTLPIPGACTNGLQDGSTLLVNGTTVNATPDNPYLYVTSQCVGSPSGTSVLANDVWYTLTTTGTSVKIDITGLPNANLVVYDGTCGAFTSSIACMVADASGNGSLTINPLAVGSVLYLQVSSYDTNAANDGNFSLTLDNDINCYDSCGNAYNIGSLPTPGACIGGIQNGAPTLINGTTLSSSPENFYSTYSNSCLGSSSSTNTTTNDVWYQFTATGTTINLNFSGLPNAIVAVYRGATCSGSNYLLGCMVADGAGNGSITIAPVQIGANYYVQISSPSINPSSNGSFTLSLDNDIDCDDCFRNGNFTATPAPVNGMYSPGQVVSFCFELTHWEQMNFNWFHGLQIKVGNGWTGTFTNTLPAATCQYVPGPSSGAWGFYPAGIGVVNGINWGTGFYFRDQGSLNPQTSFGDDCGTDTVHWRFCWDLTVKPTCDPLSDLSIKVTTSGDGESGGWTSVACFLDDSIVFNASGLALPNAVAHSNSPICLGTTLNLRVDSITGATYSWTGPNGFTSNLRTPSISPTTALDSGIYIVGVTLNGCTGYDTIQVSFLGNVLINPTSNSPVCESDSLKLFADTISGAVYTWTGPNSFNSALQNPIIPVSQLLNSGRYYIQITSGICKNNDSIDVVVNAIPSANAGLNNPTLCEDDTLYLYANTIVGAIYRWSGPNGFSSGIQNPVLNTISLLNAGDYYLEVEVNGCVGYDTITFNVNPKPAILAASNSPLCVGDNLNLATTAVVGAIYNWNGPNGFNSALQNPSINSVTSLEAGSYYLEVTLNGCKSYDTIVVVINTIPTAIAGSNSALCENDTLNLTAQTVVGATYSWSGPNGFISAIQNPSINTISIANAGDYYLEVTLSGCIGYDTTSVVINTKPLAIAGSNSPICEFDTLDLTAQAVVGATYSWTGPNGFTSAIQNPSINTVTLAANGNYVLAVTLNGCTTYDTIAITINNIPTAIAGSNSPLCENDTLNLTAQTFIGATYSWSGPNGFTSAIQNPSINTIVLANAGDYYLEVDFNGCIGYDTISVIINSNPIALAGSNSAICEGDTLDLTAQTVIGAAYSWTGPNGFTSAIQNPSINTVTSAANGNYILAVTLNGCTSFDTILVTIKPIPTAIAASNAPLCEGSTLNLTAQGVVGATYAWVAPIGFSFVQNPTFANATIAHSGNYYLSVALNGCIGYDTLSITINPFPTAVASSNSMICEGDTLKLTAQTIVGATYSWTGPNGFISNLQNPTSINVGVIDSGDYILTVTLNGCSSKDTTRVSIFPNPFTLANVNSPLCDGDTLKLTASPIFGGVYSWTGPNGFTSALQNPTINNVVAGNAGKYYLEIFQGGCKGRDSVNVVINYRPGANATSNTPLCNGDTIKLSTNNAVGSTYSWIGPNGFTSSIRNPFKANSSPIDSGDFFLRVTYNGCSSYDTVHVSVSPIPTANANAITSLCSGDTIRLTTNFVPSATYRWTGPNGFVSTLQNPTINNVNTTHTGNYYLEVSINTCKAYDTIAIAVYNYPAAVAVVNDPLCVGQTMNLLANVVPGGANYSWNGPNGFSSNAQAQNIPNVTLSNAGNYYLAVTKNGCTSYDTVYLNVYPIPNVIANSNSPICQGDTVKLTSNTIASGIYSWTGPNGFNSALQNPTIPNATLAMTGNYYLRITANGCSGYDTITVTVNPIPTANITVNTPLCSNDTIFLSTTTVPGATYSWTGPNGFISNLRNPIRTSITPLDSGDYYVRVTLNGCIGRDTAHVSIYPKPTAIANYNGPLCENDTLKLTATTVVGATYSWTGPNGFSSALQNPVINTAGILYNGVYTLRVTKNGCTSTQTINVIINSFPLANAGANSPLCDGDTIFLTSPTIVGGVYSWSGPNGFVSGQQNPRILNASINDSGNYFLQITLNGCTSFDTIPASVNRIPLAVANSNSAICQGDSLFLFANAVTNATYSWSGPNGFTSSLQNPKIPNTTNLHNGNYYLEVMANNCVGYDTINVIIKPLPLVDAQANSPICNGGTLNLTTTNVIGGVYQWDGPNGFNSGLQNPSVPLVTGVNSGKYYVQVDANGCTNYDSVLVFVDTNFTIYGYGGGIFCEHDTLFLNSTNVLGGNYSWTGPNGFISNIQNPTIPNLQVNQSGDYIITISGNGCLDIDTVSVTVNIQPNAIANSNAALCIGDTLFLTSNNVVGGNYSWTGPNGFTSAIQNPIIANTIQAMTGDYYLEIDLNGCIAYDTTSVLIDPPVSATINPAGPFCINAGIKTITAVNPGGTWSGNGITNTTTGSFNPVTAGAGNHTITYISAGGCPDTQSITITVYTVDTPNIVINPTEGCSPLVVDFSHDVLGATESHWYINGTPTSDYSGYRDTLYNAGFYDVRLDIKDANGCSSSITLNDTINLHPLPIADFSFLNDEITVMNTSVNFINNSIDNDTNLWIFLGVDSSSFINVRYKFPEVPGIYQICLEVTTRFGCKDTICKDITVKDVPYLYVPSAFTPDGNGLNDAFKPILAITAFDQYEFMIFNRWGDLVFETKDITEGWNGNFKGEEATDDVYVWRIKIKEADKIEIKSFIGHFTLVR